MKFMQVNTPTLTHDNDKVVDALHLGFLSEIPYVRYWSYTPIEDFDCAMAGQPEGTVAIFYYPPYVTDPSEVVDTWVGTPADLEAFVRILAERNYALNHDTYQIIYGISDDEDVAVRVLARRPGTIKVSDLGLEIDLIVDQDIANVARRQFMLEEDLDIFIEISEQNQISLFNDLLEFCGPANISHIENVIPNSHYPELDPFILMTAIVRQWAINHGPAYIPVAYMASVLASSHAITNRLWADNNNQPSPEVTMAYKYAAKPIAAMWEMFNIDWNLPR